MKKIVLGFHDCYPETLTDLGTKNNIHDSVTIGFLLLQSKTVCLQKKERNILMKSPLLSVLFLWCHSAFGKSYPVALMHFLHNSPAQQKGLDIMQYMTSTNSSLLWEQNKISINVITSDMSKRFLEEQQHLLHLLVYVTF